MRNALAYTRVSQISNCSIDSQKSDINEYCQENNLELLRIFNEGENSSGFDGLVN